MKAGHDLGIYQGHLLADLVVPEGGLGLVPHADVVPEHHLSIACTRGPDESELLLVCFEEVPSQLIVSQRPPCKKLN